MSTVEERFWAKVVKSDGCWEWTAKHDKNGYGRFSPNGQYSQVPAHRFSWELHNGPVPEGMLVCHRCDNPECTNPNHLFLGTPQDNMDDKVRKGRWKGCAPQRMSNIVSNRRHPVKERLTASVDKLRTLRSEGKTLTEIGVIFECDKGSVRRVLEAHNLYERIKPGPRTPHNARSAAVRAQAEEVASMAASGVSFTAIAGKLGVGRRLIAKIVKTHSTSSVSQEPGLSGCNGSSRAATLE